MRLPPFCFPARIAQEILFPTPFHNLSFPLERASNGDSAITHTERIQQNLKENLKEKLQSIHEQERQTTDRENLQLLLTQQGKDIKLMTFLQKGNFSDDQLPKIRENLFETLKTRHDGVCRILVELAERSGIMPSVKCWEDLVTKEQVENLNWRFAMIREVLKRELLQTSELMNQSSPYLTMFCIHEDVKKNGLESVIKYYSEDILLRVFSQVPLLRQDWEEPNRSSKYEYLQPGSILKYASINNHQKLFQYMLKTLSEIKGKSIVDTLEHYKNRLTKWSHPEIREIIKTIKAEAEIQQNLKEKFQSIHEQERQTTGRENLQLLLTQQEKDIQLMTFLQKGNFSDDQLLKIREHLLEVLKTRPDGACKIILELAMRSGIIMREAIPGEHCWVSRPIQIALKRNLLNTAEFIMQKHPSIAIGCFNRLEGYMKNFIRSYSDDTLLRVFSEVREAEDWHKYDHLNPLWILRWAIDENKPKLVQYMLETFPELQENP